jgi:hypothetical protein
MARRDPQEKKALSYTKDRRNVYGANDKGSRKSIRRNKRMPNRADRRRDHQVLGTAIGFDAAAEAGKQADAAAEVGQQADAAAEVGQQAEVRLLAKKSMWVIKGWRKGPDAPLAEVVARKLRRRARAGMTDPAAAEERVERIHRRLA